MSDDLVERLRDDSGDWLTDLAADRIEELEAVLRKLEYWFDIEADLLEAMTGDARADHMRKLNMIRDVLKGQDDE